MKNEIQGKKLGMSTMKGVLFTTCYFLLMVKSQKKGVKSMLDQAHFFWLFTMSKKYPFHCAHTKLFTLNFIFH